MILGLPRGEVRIVPADPGWAAAFIAERLRLEALLGAAALAIEHVGSTAVPGLDAKPILDVAIAVPDLAATANWPTRLAAAGYEYFGDREGRGEDFYAKGTDECRTVYLHVVPRASPRWRDCLRFRDALRSDPERRAAYAVLKRRAAQAHPEDRRAYTEAKAEWIRRLLLDR